MKFYFEPAHTVLMQGLGLQRVGALLLFGLGLLLGLSGLALVVVAFEERPSEEGPSEEGMRWSMAFLGVALSGAAVFCIFYAYTLGQRAPEWSVQTDSQQDASRQSASQQDTSEGHDTEGEARQPKKSNQASKTTPKPEEPITVKSTTCLVKQATTSEPRISTAETSELQVTVSVPSNARECHETVTVDAPTFGLGKEPNQPVSIVRPRETHVARWLLDPEKPGRWTIAVETKGTAS
jgi:hypothetical protein